LSNDASRRVSARAADCEEWAEKLADHPKLKASYLDLARLWRAMAEETDKIDAEAKGTSR
jgi:hypothetical protein